MSTTIFLHAEGVTGESQDKNHKGWTDVTSFEWGVSQPASMSTDGGGGAGKATFHDLVIHASVDKATSALLSACSAGKHISKVEVSVCKAGGHQIEYCRITLEEVMVTDVSYDGSNGNDILDVSYSFQAARVRHQYWQQTATGGKGAEVAAGWNIKENREI